LDEVEADPDLRCAPRCHCTQSSRCLYANQGIWAAPEEPARTGQGSVG
jgi:hypothetical protein